MANPTVSANTNGNRIIQRLSNPYLGAIGTLASVIGIPLAIYLYIQSIEKPQLTVFFNPVRAQIYRADQTSRLQISHNGQLIESDISAVQVAVWNNGKKSIRNVNILEPIIIYTKSNVPILEASIRTQSRSVVKISLDQSNISRGKLGVTWDILEQSDGGVIQIIYGGSPDMDFGIAGVIEGQKSLQEYQPSLLNITDTTKSTSLLSPTFPGIFLIGAGIFLAWYSLRRLRFRTAHGRFKSRIFFALLLLIIIIYIVGGVILVFFSPPVPPFEF